MAWEISITDEGLGEIYEALERMSSEALAKALADYNYERFHGTFGVPANPHHIGKWDWKKLACLPHDILVEACFDCIGEVNTCDNGGYAYWIDPEGYHKVTLSD